ncbi:hypothetical protein COCC4DRAFT_61570 [Bipolaris maydis ATCC 48331]|uniref:DUF6590 domain-containing protein n=2 Tax=Cochliobolus heterostrophus TaxID=5016 RepID=M2VC97_COCH5|nr:uncharacterized protein COCC4DRAFT_61570 [Bipolaris maydis ATCC 48331]EMD97318.1 hypothetical protein COCHEDRAFT_1150971 [Bipolaris maydis C5]KAJ5029742.1 hypothetical protein J3E73DRAFT_367161 [Bipolaris maydis]ENI04222.1 hypothetical protein COCC4DRAFT_61570 [Bipolaris maydis ATCC 48331]KAJ6203108.1 hypothetical protein J3E72DRAFT_390707 [Bipolaris maydis]KAJ6214458.1 hypothetical protein PSV09DRAFT_1150971 [Bipolaris maydis]
MTEPVWDAEHQRYLRTHWDEQYGRYYRNHYVEEQGWVFFDWLPFDWLPPQSQPTRTDSPQGVRAGPASTPAIEGPEIRGTYNYNQPAPNSHVESLDHSYFVRPSSFFTVGKVFSVLFSEAAGSTATAYNNSISIVRYGEYVHSQIRRFIVVAPRHGFCFAVPIFTYGGQGTKKHGVLPSAHAIAYSLGSMPSLLEGESSLDKDPICIMMAQGVPQLSQASRIFFGIHHPTQHNVKVKDIGDVHPDHIHKLLGYWNTQNYSPGD